MSKFRKKPVVIEAFQVGSSRFYPEWLHEAVSANVVVTHAREGSDGWKEPFDHADIQTLEGVMRADRGDWIIRGVEGELYPCKDSIFRQTYEPAEDGEPPAQQPHPDDPAHTIEALNDQLQDQAIELDMLREALGVPYEPHQSLLERMLEAARGRAGSGAAPEPPAQPRKAQSRDTMSEYGVIPMQDQVSEPPAQEPMTDAQAAAPRRCKPSSRRWNGRRTADAEQRTARSCRAPML